MLRLREADFIKNPTFELYRSGTPMVLAAGDTVWLQIGKPDATTVARLCSVLTLNPATVAADILDTDFVDPGDYTLEFSVTYISDGRHEGCEEPISVYVRPGFQKGRGGA